MKNLAAKEASYILVVGYSPVRQMNQEAWEAQVKRNEISKEIGGIYVQKAPQPRPKSNLQRETI